MKKYQEYLIVSFIIVSLIILLFYKFINGDYIFASGDTLAPQAIKYSIDSIKDKTGSFPYWFPYIFSGMPTVHSLLNINEFYFPQKIIKLFHQLGLPWIWNFLLHYLFSALGMYSLLRFLRQSKIVSIFSSILFSLSPYMIAYFVHGHGSQIMTASYIPWIMLFLFKIYKKVNIINFSFLSLLVGLQLQRGHIQIAYYTWMMIALFILVNFFINYKNSINTVIIRTLVILSSLLVGFLTSLSIYLPVLNYVPYSVRGGNNGGYGIENATQWSLHVKEFITFIIPYSYGFGGQNYWGFLPFTDFPNYIGILIIFLAFLGLLKTKLNKEYKIFFLVTLFLSILLSLGKYLPSFYSIFYNYLPFFDKFRAPIFILIIFQFCIYVLAACGLDSLPELLRNKFARKNIFFGFLIMLIIIGISSLYTPKLYPHEKFNGKEVQFFNQLKESYSQVLVQQDLNNDKIYDALDKNIFNEWTNSDAKLYYSYIKLMSSNKTSDSLISILKLTDSNVEKIKKSLHRDYIFIFVIIIFIMLLSYIYSSHHFLNKSVFLFIMIVFILVDYFRINREIIDPKYHVPNKFIVKKKLFIDEYLEQDELTRFLSSDLDKFRVLDLTGNNSSRFAAFNIETINGYHPAKLYKYNKILNAIIDKGSYPLGLLQALNVKYIIHKENGNIPGFSKLNSKFKFKYYSNESSESKYINSYVYKNNQFLNRLFFVEKITLLDNEEIILNKMMDDSFNPKINSYINIENLTDEQIIAIENIKFSKGSELELISWEPNKIIFKSISDSPQVIFLSEIYYPGWVVNDNNIININGLFRGLIISKGEKRYIMEFKPKDLYVGKLISNIMYLLLLSFACFGSYRSRLKNV